MLVFHSLSFEKVPLPCVEADLMDGVFDLEVVYVEIFRLFSSVYDEKGVVHLSYRRYLNAWLQIFRWVVSQKLLWLLV